LVVKIPKVKNKKLKTKLLEWLLVWTVDAEGIAQEHRIKALSRYCRHQRLWSCDL